MIRIFKRLPGVILWCFSSAWQEKKHCRIREPILRLKKRTSDTPGNKYNESSGWKIPEKYESYLRDQFPGRDHWVSFQTDMELFMGKMKFIMFTSERTITFWNTIQKKSLIRSRFPKSAGSGEVCRKSKTERGCPCDDGADKVVDTPGKTSGICPSL